MIIDFHTHTFPDKIAQNALEKLSRASHTKPFTAGTDTALQISAQNAGIDLSVVLPVATNPEKISKINNCSIAKNGQDRLLFFGCMHPDAPNWKDELRRLAEAEIKGIKLHPIYQGVNFDDPRFLRILDYAGTLDLIVITHAGEDIGFPGVIHCSPQMIQNALQQVGPVKLVLAHMGGWRNWDEVEQLLPQTSVFLDTSFSTGKLTPLENDSYYSEDDLQLLNESSFLRMVRLFGPERILFATDSPWSSQADSRAWIEALPLPQAERQAILGKNAAALLNLSL